MALLLHQCRRAEAKETGNMTESGVKGSKDTVQARSSTKKKGKNTYPRQGLRGQEKQKSKVFMARKTGTFR